MIISPKQPKILTKTAWKIPFLRRELRKIGSSSAGRRDSAAQSVASSPRTRREAASGPQQGLRRRRRAALRPELLRSVPTGKRRERAARAATLGRHRETPRSSRQSNQRQYDRRGA